MILPSGKGSHNLFYRWLLPAIIFQSVFMGGGFTTGREVMEYCGKYGALGIYSIIAATIGFFVSTSLTYELARVTKSFDYRTLMKQILWKFWPLFEIAYIILAIIVIAVVGSAAANIFEDMVGIPYIIGAIVVIALIGILHFYGRTAIEWFETVGTVILYIMYSILWIVTIKTTWGHANLVLAQKISTGTSSISFVKGIQYFAYNMVVIPAVLFTLDRLDKRTDSFMSGLFSTLLVIIAFTLTWISILGFYPDPSIINAPVPWYAIMKRLGILWITWFYVLAVTWTLIETGTGMIHSIMRRIDINLEEVRGKGLSRTWEAIIATLIAIISIFLAKYGIIALVAKGYGTLAWVFFAIYFIPLVTVGIIRIIRPEWKKEFWSKA